MLQKQISTLSIWSTCLNLGHNWPLTWVSKTVQISIWEPLDIVCRWIRQLWTGWCMSESFINMIMWRLAWQSGTLVDDAARRVGCNRGWRLIPVTRQPLRLTATVTCAASGYCLYRHWPGNTEEGQTKALSPNYVFLNQKKAIYLMWETVWWFWNPRTRH